MARSHLKQQYERAEVHKRTLISCHNSLNNYLLCETYAATTWGTLKARLMALKVNISPSFISCKICEEGEMGHFFETTKEIVLCANHLRTEDFDSTVTHEVGDM